MTRRAVFRATLATLALSLMLAGGYFHVAATPLAVRHRPAVDIAAFDFTSGSFEDYVAYSRARIAAARTDLDARPAAQRRRIVAGNAPFMLRPAAHCPRAASGRYRRGILLTHGLGDSPYQLRSLGEFFRQQCFLVLAILLPGHGTRPGDLLHSDWRQWLALQRFGVARLAAMADELHLLGFSTGATLALYHALDDPRIRALYLFSPALQVHPLAGLATLYRGIGSVLAPALWLRLAPDENLYSYESFPTNAAVQIHDLTEALQQRLARRPPLHTPLFVAASAEDFTVIAPATLELLQRLPVGNNVMLLYSATPEERGAPFRVIPSHVPQQRLLSSAHTAIVIPPDDPYYGAHGRYAWCLHYLDRDPQAYRRCKAFDEDFLGEITAANLDQGVVRRLTYNPWYRDMLDALTAFIARLDRGASPH